PRALVSGPALLPCASRARLEDQHFVLAGGEGRVAVPARPGTDRSVYRRVQRLEGVGESLRMTAGQARRPASLLIEDRRVAKEDFVRTSPMSDPQLVWPFRVPCGGGGRAVDLEDEGILASGPHLE